MTKTISQPKAADLLQRSKLHQTPLQLMGEDVDLSKLYLKFGDKTINIEAAVTDVIIHRTIEGASTVTVTVEDTDHSLLRSGKLSSGQDTEIDGLFFRLAQVSIQGLQLTLVFEDREVALLRKYTKPIKQGVRTSRKNITRAQFVLRMLREVREVPPIPYVIPELDVIEPIAGSKQLPQDPNRLVTKAYGIPPMSGLTVKGSPMTAEQRRNADTMLSVGLSIVDPLKPRPLLVMGIMAAIQESAIRNLTADQSPGNHSGILQQDPRYWPASGDVGIDAAAFFESLKQEVVRNPNEQYYAAIEGVQHSGQGQLYAQWRTEAERIVTAFGIAGGTAAIANSQWDLSAVVSGDYEFYRGIPPSVATFKKKGKTGWGRESSWDAMGRLADEVSWRRFFVSGVFYFISDDDLFSSKPIGEIDHDTPGVIDISGDYDEAKKSATVTIECFMNRWAAPPGSVILLTNMGPWNGRWLVNDVERSAFDPKGTITLKKPTPRLPEPAGTNVGQGVSAAQTWTNTPIPADADPNQQFPVQSDLVQPVPAGHNNNVIQGVHNTAGLPGYPAIDFGADAGAPIIAVETGEIVKLSGHDPAQGPSDPVLGVHGPFGWSAYLLGESGTEYYYTHMGTRSVQLGQKVLGGTQIGTVGDYAKWGGANHVHVGVHPADSGHPDVHDLLNAAIASG